MEWNKEQLELARTAKSPEELQKLAEEKQIVLSEEQAQEYFDKLNRTGALSDEELDNVAGGCGNKTTYLYRCYCCSSWSVHATSQSEAKNDHKNKRGFWPSDVYHIIEG